MCIQVDPPKSEMGFDSSLLKSVLEQFVDEIGEESVELIVDRPRFAHAVVVIADDDCGELCEASCVRQIDDIILHETHVANVDAEWADEEIQRALRELTESKELLETPRNSVLCCEDLENANVIEKSSKIITTTTKTEEVNTMSRIHFPSMARARSSSRHRQIN